MHQTKEQDKFPETNSYETELYDFPNRGLKVTLVKMLSRAQRTMKQRVKNYNKKRQKHKEEPKRNHGAKEHNDRTEKFIADS